MSQIDEIKQKLDIVDVVGSYVSLQKSGRNYKGVCPFHSEKTPSFMVSQELQIFKCFGCSQAGDIFKFIQEIEGVDFHQSLEILAERAGIKLEKNQYGDEDSNKKILMEINHISALFYHYVLTRHPMGKTATEYAKKKRKLTEKTIDEFLVGYAPDSWDTLYKALVKKGYKPQDIEKAGVIVSRSSGGGYIDKFRDRLIFPLFDVSGKVVGFAGRTISNKEPKYLNSPETPVFHKSSFLFCLDKAKVAAKRDGMILVEGQMDAITAHQFGISNVVASGGTSLTVNQLKAISRYTKDLLFCFDSDTAGSAAIQRGIELAERENFNIKVILLPDGYKDLDELLHANTELAREIINNPVPIYDFYLAAAFKKNDRTTALGKKLIVEELTPVFQKVSNTVIVEHYVKKLSDELKTSPEILQNILQNKTKPEEAFETAEKEVSDTALPAAKRTPNEFILALLLKAPLDISQTFLYKLGQKDFPDSKIQQIFIELKDYLIGRKHKFKIEYFSARLDDDQRKIVEELYLWDMGDITEDPKQLERELEATFDRLKKESAKKELTELTEKIKQAELEKDTKLLKELTEKVKVLSGRLV